jgi:hypothetical protein
MPGIGETSYNLVRNYLFQKGTIVLENVSQTATSLPNFLHRYHVFHYRGASVVVRGLFQKYSNGEKYIDSQIRVVSEENELEEKILKELSDVVLGLKAT